MCLVCLGVSDVTVCSIIVDYSHSFLFSSLTAVGVGMWVCCCVMRPTEPHNPKPPNLSPYPLIALMLSIGYHKALLYTSHDTHLLHQFVKKRTYIIDLSNASRKKTTITPWQKGKWAQMIRAETTYYARIEISAQRHRAGTLLILGTKHGQLFISPPLFFCIFAPCGRSESHLLWVIQP